MANECTVYLRDAFENDSGYAIPQIPVGTLGTDPLTGRLWFKYFAPYLELGAKAIAIDPVNLPLGVRKFDLGRHGCGAIRDAAPDSWGRTVIDASQKGRVLHEIDYIRFPNPGRIGNLDFGEFTPRKMVSLAEYPNAHALFRKIEAGSILGKNDCILLQRKFYGASIGGARPKCVVEDENGELWIAKMRSIKDVWPEERIEKSALELAEICGINTAESRMIH